MKFYFFASEHRVICCKARSLMDAWAKVKQAHPGIDWAYIRRQN